ncbi:MAG TPA: LuxR C-terminal-related transcriptional regulator [Streptosporangiaceae bacterium]
MQGRAAELARIEAWLRHDGPAQQASDPSGPGSVLVIEGEPGIGKTTLWTEATRWAREAGWDVLSCRPAPSDAGLPHLGLADLLRSVPEEDFAGLPRPQRRPLAVALLREEAGEGDLEPRSVGTGLTALLAVLAGRRPQMLAVDDAQWLDAASARSLAFALRRLDDRPLRLLAAVRIEPPPEGGAAEPPQRSGAFAMIESSLDRRAIERLPVGPLSVAATHQMFRQVLGVSFARPVLVRIHRAAGGNPFYALEIAREMHRLGVPPPGEPLPIPDDARDLALVRLRRLPPATRDALARVAAMSRPSTASLDLGALAPAEQAGIVRVRKGGWIEFTHPLYGSALYSSLPESARRALHSDLAAVAGSLEERARHLALGADGPDETTAGVLDRAAETAAARGAADVAVELKELACQLTSANDSQGTVRRSLGLANLRYFAGDPTGARRELEKSLHTLPPSQERAEVLLQLGSVLWTQGDSDEGMVLLSQALGEAETGALRARIHTRISALHDDCDVSVEHGEAALALLDPGTDPLLYSFALHNVALFRLYAGHGADHDAITEGMRLQERATSWELSTVPAYWARNMDDFATARQRFEDLLRVFGERGDEASSSGVLTHLAMVEAMTGRMDRARALAADALDLAEQTEQETYLHMALWAQAGVCARSGALDEARAVAGQLLRRLEAHPDIVLEGMARAVLGMVALSAGDLAEADRQFSLADEVEELHHSREPATSRFQADHVEAVIGLGDLTRAGELVRRLEARAVALPRPWILTVSARCRGLLNAAAGHLDEALADYQRALAAHAALDMPAEHGRTLLALGRLHRRRNERQRAQAVLTEAAAVFQGGGALDWAAVAADELRRARGRRGSPQRLTPTERHIAELASAGLRNHEIAAKLFVSPKTVEANLSRVYAKLGIRSRAELAGRLAAPDPLSPQP